MDMPHLIYPFLIQWTFWLFQKVAPYVELKFCGTNTALEFCLSYDL